MDRARRNNTHAKAIGNKERTDGRWDYDYNDNSDLRYIGLYACLLAWFLDGATADAAVAAFNGRRLFGCDPHEGLFSSVVYSFRIP
jgi:hypothetical protein